MRKYGLSIDPGMSNGACLFSWGDGQDEYFRQEQLFQFRGGAAGLDEWLKTKGIMPFGSSLRVGFRDPFTLDALIVEKFTPRGGPGFSLTLASVEPLRGEGVLIGHGLLRFIKWQEPAAQYFMGGASLADKKKRSREFLKLNGLYATGKLFGQPDADDAISAELHAIAYLRSIKHMPTLVELFGPKDDE